MTPMEKATAAAAATAGSWMARAAVTPTRAEIVLPPRIDHGCASGLDGTANSNTAEAPMGATSSGRCGLAP